MVTPEASRQRDPLGDVQHAVDPVAHDERILLRLEMDVAGAVLGCLEDERVDEPHERRVRDAVVGLQVVRLDRHAHLLDRVFHQRRVERAGGAGHAAELDEDVVADRDRELRRVPGRQPELVEPLDVLRLGDRDPQPLAVERERDRAHALEHGQRDQPGRGGVDALDGEVDQRQVELLGERPRGVERAREGRVARRGRRLSARIGVAARGRHRPKPRLFVRGHGELRGHYIKRR